jgi:hypothetical protein
MRDGAQPGTHQPRIILPGEDDPQKSAWIDELLKRRLAQAAERPAPGGMMGVKQGGACTSIVEVVENTGPRTIL